MSVNSVVDERTLREIYFSAFEAVVKQAKPWTVMCRTTTRSTEPSPVKTAGC